MKVKRRSVEQRRNPKKLLALLFVGLFFLSAVPIASADPGWNYRREITIANSGGALTDYQVLVKLTTTNFDYSKANTDGSDLRFTNYANTVKYNYWIEEWDASGESMIWVNVPSVPVGNLKMYMWYGNSAANSESDGDVTFEFFDDFEGTSLDTSKWNMTGQKDSNVTWTLENGYLKFYYTGGTWWSGCYIGTTSFPTISTSNGIGLIAEAKNYHQTGDTSGERDFHQLMIFSDDITPEFDTWGGLVLDNYFKWWQHGNDYDFGNTTNYSINGNIVTYSEHQGSNPLDTNKHNIKLSFQSSDANVVYNGGSLISAISPDINVKVLYLNFEVWRGDGASTYFDEVRVRKYADPEPTTSVGDEEQNGELIPEFPTIAYQS